MKTIKHQHNVVLKSTATHSPAAYCTTCKHFVSTVFSDGKPTYMTAAELRHAQRNKSGAV